MEQTDWVLYSLICEYKVLTGPGKYIWQQAVIVNDLEKVYIPIE